MCLIDVLERAVPANAVSAYPAFFISPEDLELSIACVIDDTHDAIQAMLKDAELKITSRKASRKHVSSWIIDGEVIN